MTQIPHETNGVTLVPVGPAEIAMLEEWFEDEQLRVRLGGMLPLRDWFAYLGSGSGHHAWLACREGRAIGYVDVQAAPDGTASMIVLMNPQLRRHGYCNDLVAAALACVSRMGLKRIQALIELDTAASLQCFRHAGFHPSAHREPASKGFANLVYEVET